MSSAKDMRARRLARRHRSERIFRALGMSAVAFALFALAALLGSIVYRGLPAFFQHELLLEIHFDAAKLAPEGDHSPEALARADFAALVRAALFVHFPEAEGSRSARRALYRLVSSGAHFEVRDALLASPELLGARRTFSLLLSDDADLYLKGHSEGTGRLTQQQANWLLRLQEAGRVRSAFAHRFFSGGDSREPEMAGVLGALVGSAWTLLVTLLLSFPLGVAAAVYLEEFAPKNRITDLIEVNINNLAAVPSIVFGLLGLSLFLNSFGLPRSAPLVGGMVLALLTLPTIIIAGRSAILAVSPAIREAALGVGASRMQVTLQHVLPQALPGILTGSIIGMARALGESAPLLMIGMVAFIVDVPGGPLDSATALPVQVFIWADSPERAFQAKTSAAILVLLVFLVLMNLGAVLIRQRFIKGSGRG